MNNVELIELAKEAQLKAYVPYSGFRVGAALLTNSGKVYTGLNIENVSYGLTVCAERMAVFKAVTEGETGFKRLAVVSDAGEIALPCGACLQVLAEFCKTLPILMVDSKGGQLEKDLTELLPFPFNSLKKKFQKDQG